MTLVRELAMRSRAELPAETREYLRALTLTNAAAAAGDLGRLDALTKRLPLDPHSPGGAALMYAARLHARTQDDFHPTGRIHVGAVALAAALALTDETADRLLDVVAAGYRAMCTVACVYAGDAQRRGYRPTGVFGPIGAAASAAAALELDDETTAAAIALAAARSGGTNQSWLAGTDEWVLEVGYAARSGVEAALLAAAGFRGAADALEGAAGWARAFFDDDGASRLRRALEEDRDYVLEVAQKPYPVSGIAQVATHLACQAHASSFPRQVEVHLAASEAAYPGTSNRGPFRSRSDALMSVAFCVACGLADGTIRLARLDAANELGRHVGEVAVHPDSELPEGEAVLVVSWNGAPVAHRAAAADLLHARWDDAPLGASALATRSEAPIEIVEELRSALAADRPRAHDVTVALGRAA